MLNGKIASTLPGYMFDQDNPVPIAELNKWPEILHSRASTFHLASLSDGHSDAARGVKAWLESMGGKALLVSALKLGGNLIGLFGLGFDHEKEIAESKKEVFKALRNKLPWRYIIPGWYKRRGRHGTCASRGGEPPPASA